MASNNIHRQQLFHWIGGDIEGYKNGRVKIRRRLTDRERESYLGHLSNAISNGLWMKIPRIPETIEDGSKISHHGQKIPVTCFTEWTLNLSAPHTAKYGRLGLGFSKNWVMSRGGQPVTYFKSTGARRLYANAMLELNSFLNKQPKSKKGAELLQKFNYVAAFSRAVKSPPIPFSLPVKKQVHWQREVLHYVAETDAPKYHALPPDPVFKELRQLMKRQKADNFKRRFGVRLDLAEEREWRIVYHPELRRKGVIIDGLLPPDYFVPFVPGKELFTVVLPDNRTVSMALQCDPIRRELFASNRPHVTILSFEDIGTF